MSDSSLVNHTKLSPNHSGKRTHTIDRITPHCVVGQCSVETLGNIFMTNGASCNYGIGTDGRVLLCVDEKNRSWCSSSNANDQRSVTIECASDTYAPYAMNSKVYDKLIKLCADICKRNGKKKLLWFGDESKTLNYSPKSDEMVLTVHRWFANKSCPGDWLYSRLGDLANKVNKLLGSNTITNSESEEDTMEAKLNDKNNFVWVIKKDLLLLKKLGVITQGVDDNGSFGNGTLAAIKQVQQKAGIKVDGICGTNTIKAIGKLLNDAVSKTNSAELNKYKAALSNANTKISNAKKVLA